jgi:hypothetical protein
MPLPQRTLDDVARQLRHNKERGRSCALLIGAGCSVQARIPLAGEFVEEIRKRFPEEYARAAEKTYPYCMGELSPADRHDLITEFIDKAKINWAHISIAQLMKGGFVDRVLTTNFDPLMMRACALVNLFPAIYDMAVVRKDFLADFVRDLAVFHLHGQRDGFVQLHNEEEVSKLAEAIEPLFDDTARDRSWLVVGYSGANDPVFRVLADRPRFANRLFWVGFRDEMPSPAVQQALLGAGKEAYWVAGFDADNFLVQLANKLGCFPPGFFAKPFSHLLEGYSSLAGFCLPGQDTELDWAARARGWIQDAIARFEDAFVAAAETAAAPGPPRDDQRPPAPAVPGIPASPGTGSGGLARDPGAYIAYEVEPQWRVPLPPIAAGAPVADPVGEAWTALIAGDYDRVVALANQQTTTGNPGFAEALAWSYVGAGNAQRAQAAMSKSKADADAFLEAAAASYAKAVRIEPKAGAYNLAALAAVRRQEDDCRRWLQVAKTSGAVNRDQLEADADFASMRDRPWFQDLLQAL